MQKCKSCGTDIEDNSDVCWHCEKPLHEKEEQPITTDISTEKDESTIKSYSKEPYNNNILSGFLTFFSIILLFFALGSTVYLLNKLGADLIKHEPKMLIIPGILLFYNFLFSSWCFGLARSLNQNEKEDGWLINALQLFGVLAIIVGIICIASAIRDDNPLPNAGNIGGILLLLYNVVFAFISFGIAGLLDRKRHDELTRKI